MLVKLIERERIFKMYTACLNELIKTSAMTNKIHSYPSQLTVSKPVNFNLSIRL